MKNQQTTQMLKSYYLSTIYQKLLKKTNVLFLLADINSISFITMPKQIQKKNTTLSNSLDPDPVICT